MILSAQVWETDPGLKSYSVSNRECRFPDEHPKTWIFPDYKQSNCLYECSLKAVVSSSPCIPWDVDYPFRPEGSVICDGPSAEAFYDQMRLNGTKNNCPQCYEQDCNWIKYWAKVKAMLISFTLAMWFQQTWTQEGGGVRSRNPIALKNHPWPGQRPKIPLCE